MWGEMGWCGALECEMVPPRSPYPTVGWGELGWVDAPPPSPEKKNRGLHPTTLAPAFLSLHHTPTKSNPDMRNSKLAHTQAGF